MIVSKANLQAINVVKKDKGTEALYVLYIEEDGSTFSISQQAVVGVSPCRGEVKEKLDFLKESGLEGTVILHGESVNDVLKNIPSDTLFQGLLEHCDVNEQGQVQLSDGKRRKIIKCGRQEMEPMPYRNVIARALSSRQTVKSVVNLVNLKALLEVVEKACGDKSGELPVYIEFSDKNDLIIRAEHPKFGQRVVAVMTTYRGIGGKWMEDNAWEERLTKNAVVKKKPKLKLKLKGK